MEIQLKPETPAIYALILFAIILLLVAYAFYNYRPQIKKIFAAALSERAKSSLEREDAERTKQVGRILNFIFFLSIGWIVYAFEFKLKIIEVQSFPQFALFVGLIIAILSLKYALHKLVGWIFEEEGITNRYLNDAYYKYRLFGLFLIPSGLFILYAPFGSLIAIGVVFFCFAGLWLYRCGVGMYYAFQNNSLPNLYSFLYICTFEILPFIIVGKVFSEQLLNWFSVLF